MTSGAFLSVPFELFLLQLSWLLQMVLFEVETVLRHKMVVKKVLHFVQVK